MNELIVHNPTEALQRDPLVCSVCSQPVREPNITGLGLCRPCIDAAETARRNKGCFLTVLVILGLLLLAFVVHAF
jgi:hypothetical protein